MPNLLHQYLANDHDRIDRLLKHAAVKNPQGEMDILAYEEFRKALLRHISIEEKIAFPALIGQLGDAIKPVLVKLHLDHSAIVELLVPAPTASVVETILSILAVHNTLEEKPDGIYELLGTLGQEASRTLLERFQSAPEVPTLPTKPLAQVIGAVRRSVERAGYTYIDEEN